LFINLSIELFSDGYYCPYEWPFVFFFLLKSIIPFMFVIPFCHSVPYSIPRFTNTPLQQHDGKPVYQFC